MGYRFYMVPESEAANAIHLYKAVHFPAEWQLARVLLHGAFSDPSILRHNGRWWMFAGNGAMSSKPTESLHLFSADELLGDWREHPKSPVVVGNPRASRPGGRILSWNGRLVRFAQDGEPLYGS